MENQGEDFVHVEQVEHVEFCRDTPRRGFPNAENAKVIYTKNAKTPKTFAIFT